MTIISRLKPLNLLVSKSLRYKFSIKNIQIRNYEYRYRKLNQPTKLNYAIATSIGTFMWYWIFFHLYYDFGKVAGHYYPPDATQWTDEELGVPPDDFD